MEKALKLIAQERERQIRLGYTPEHDKIHNINELLYAAAAYLLHSIIPYRAGMLWPWLPKNFKPSTPQRNAVKAGALVVAALELLGVEEQEARDPVEEGRKEAKNRK